MDRCVCCGDYVPEGRQVCWRCERYKPFKAILRRKPRTGNKTLKQHKNDLVFDCYRVQKGEIKCIK